MTARQGMHTARVWAAPRLDQLGRAIQESVAPRMAASLAATARRIEPTSPRRRRWPMLAAGIVMIAGGSMAAAFLLSRRGQAPMMQPGRPTPAHPEMAGADAASADGHMNAS
jgi:hypothetical protein